MTTKNIPEQLLPELLKQFPDKEISIPTQSVFKACQETGSTLWLDTGDTDAIDRLISPEIEALTTNNTLLNKEVQKGIYDGVIRKYANLFEEMLPDERVTEIAFLLNALHALRLVKRYNAKVSVELHTNVAHDIDGILHYGQRFYNIDPQHFLIKVPLTASGIIGARKLHELGIPVNFTLLFSVRQNMLSTLLAQPAYTNVFLGRIGAYLAQNNLCEAEGPGEKTVHQTQKCLTTLRQENGAKTKLIAASIRNYKQLPALCGIDVLTIPAQIAADAIKNLSGPFITMIDHDFNIVYKPGVATSEIQIDKLWNVSDIEKRVFRQLQENMPSSATELVDQLREAGVPDIFPLLTPVEELFIAEEGKIPNHSRWTNAIARRETAIDTLLNLGGLAAFTKDQKELDMRVEKIAGWSEKKQGAWSVEHGE